MTDNLKQRRGKKIHDNALSTAQAENTPSTSSSETTSGSQLSPIEQLRSAQARLIISRDRTADLHTAWRNQLFRLSLLMVLVSMHQFHSPISSCINEIKASNEAVSGAGEASENLIGGMQAIRILFSESFCELLGVFISSLLAYFLALSRVNPFGLDSWPYVVSSALVPTQLGFYFHSKKLGCLGGNELMNSEAPTYEARQFPVVVIYHTIVTFAFWFMKSGMQQCEEHVKLVGESIRDLERMDEKLKLKKQKQCFKK